MKNTLKKMVMKQLFLFYCFAGMIVPSPAQQKAVEKAFMSCRG